MASNIAGLFRSVYGGNIGRQAAALQAAQQAQQAQLQRLEFEARNQQIENQGLANTNAIIQNATSGIVGGLGAYQEGQRAQERFALEKENAQRQLDEQERQRKDALAAAAAEQAAAQILDTATPPQQQLQIVGPTGKFELPQQKPLKEWMAPMEEYRQAPAAPAKDVKPTSAMVDELMGNIISQQKNTKFSAEDQQRARGILSARIAKAKMDSTTVQLSEAEKRSNLNKLRFAAIDDALDSSVKPNGTADDARLAARGVYEELAQSIPGLKEKDVVDRAQALWTIKEQKYRAAEQDIKTKAAQASNYLEVAPGRDAGHERLSPIVAAREKAWLRAQADIKNYHATHKNANNQFVGDPAELKEYENIAKEARQKYDDALNAETGTASKPKGDENKDNPASTGTPAPTVVEGQNIVGEKAPPLAPPKKQPPPTKAPVKDVYMAPDDEVVWQKVLELARARGINIKDGPAGRKLEQEARKILGR